MRLSSLARAAGKSPAYVARRAVDEAVRRVRNPLLRRRIARLDADAIASSATPPSLFPAGEADRLRNLYGPGGPFAAHRAGLVAALDRIEAGVVDLLGSGPVTLPEPIDWHRDFKSGRSWPLVAAERIDPYGPGEPADVKVPWELSRGADLVTLGRAWVVLRDPRAVKTFERRLAGWLLANPPGVGVNWASSMDAALRAVAWTWALALLESAGAPLSDEVRRDALASLFAHGLWIEANLERGQVLGNHFVADALGLVCCGSLFGGTRDGARWLELGGRYLEEEIRSQVGGDGVDFEGSVAYHGLVLEMFLVGMRVMELSGRVPSPEYGRRLVAMIDFVAASTTTSGLAPVVGDADDGRALRLSEAADFRDHRALLSTGAALFAKPDWKAASGRFHEDSLWLLGTRASDAFAAIPLPGPSASRAASRSFPESGFHVLETPEQYLFVDAGPVGARGTGGHGHNDCLSFEWHAEGKPLLTDSGAYVYSASREERNWFRSTAAHNGIRVDGEEINRIPSPSALFALRDDARPRDVRAELDGPAPSLEASHTGYLRLADPVLVTRRFELSANGATLSIRDRLDGREAHAVEFFFHAAPGARAVSPEGGGGAAAFEWGDGRRLVIRPDAEVAWIEGEGWFSPSYGVKIARPYWVASARRRLPLEIGWSLVLEP